MNQPTFRTSFSGRVWLALLAAGLLLSLGLSGCDLLWLLGDSEQAQVENTAEEWAEVHSMDLVTDDGNLDVDAAGKVFRRYITNSTGDPEVDAALNSDDAIDKITKADELVKRGWQNRDLRDFDNAVRLRPEDWSYRISRASYRAYGYTHPNMDKLEADFAAAERMLGPSKEERLRYAELGIYELEHIKMVPAKYHEPNSGDVSNLFVRPKVCQVVFSRLAHFYHIRADQTGNSGDREMAYQYERDLTQCP